MRMISNGRGLRLVAEVALAAAVAACGSGGASPSPVATAAPATAKTSVTPVAPPAASLVIADGIVVPGELGSYTWDGGGSDAPWIVVPESGRVKGAATMEIRLNPAADVTAWSARWALISDGVAGPPQDGSTGTTAPMTVTLPTANGDWSLQVEIRAGNGRSATYYWRVSAGA